MIRSLQRGHAPNCSSSGSVVGAALLSTAAAAVVVNAWAWRFLRWLEGGPPPGGQPPRLRAEEGGALLHDAEGTIARLDEEGARAAQARGALAVGGRPAPAGALSAPTEVHLALTARCPARCPACYLDAGPAREDGPGLDELRPVLDELAAMGVFELALGGGEVLGRPDLVELLDEIRARGMRPNLTSAGFGLGEARAEELAGRLGQINISLDGLAPIDEQVRGYPAARVGLRAVERLSRAGLRVGVNTVLSAPLLGNADALEALGRAIAAAGAAEWQWLRFKPLGRGREAEALKPSPDQMARVWPRALEQEAATGLVLRFDCALVPFLVAHAPPVEALERLAVRGCPAGHSLWAREVSGAMAPCSFLPGAAAEDLAEAWTDQPRLVRWRAAALPAPCEACAYKAVCRGGCRAVAPSETEADPDCPRVRAWAA